MSTVSAAFEAPSVDPQAVRRENATMAIVGVAHGTSHFFHLTLAPLFPWLKDAFALSYAELGLLVTVFFVVSSIGQALSGFLVDRVGAFPVMMAALGCFVLAACALAAAPGYAGLMLGAVLCGMGNAPFHPVDYSILNARIGPTRLGKAYAVHGVSGSLGWALAPALLVSVAQVAGWRMAFLAAGLVALAMMALIWRFRDLLQGVGGTGSVAQAANSAPALIATIDAATSAGRRLSFGAGATLPVPARTVVASAPLCSVVVVIPIPRSCGPLLGEYLCLADRDPNGVDERQRDGPAASHARPVHGPIRRRPNHIPPLPAVRVPTVRAVLHAEAVPVRSPRGPAHRDLAVTHRPHHPRHLGRCSHRVPAGRSRLGHRAPGRRSRVGIPHPHRHPHQTDAPWQRLRDDTDRDRLQVHPGDRLLGQDPRVRWCTRGRLRQPDLEDHGRNRSDVDRSIALVDLPLGATAPHRVTRRRLRRRGCGWC